MIALRMLAAIALVLVAAAGARAELEYVETLTKGVEAADPVPIVLAVHGLGDRPEAFQILLDNLGVKARLIFPRAPIPYGTDGGGAWFEMHSGDEAMAGGITTAAAQLVELIGALHAKAGGPPRVVVTGFSQGGMLAYALASSHPELVSAAVPVSGFLPMPLWPAQRPTFKPLPRILALHGEKDQVVPIQDAKWSVEALRSNGFEVQLRSYPDLGHTISKEERADLHEALIAAVNDLTPKPPPENPAADAPAGDDAESIVKSNSAPPQAAPSAPAHAGEPAHTAP